MIVESVSRKKPCPNSLIQQDIGKLLDYAGIKYEKVKEFADNVYENFEEFKPSTDILEKDYSVRILQMLRYVEKMCIDLRIHKKIIVFIIFLVKCIKIS